MFCSILYFYSNDSVKLREMWNTIKSGELKGYTKKKKNIGVTNMRWGKDTSRNFPTATMLLIFILRFKIGYLFEKEWLCEKWFNIFLTIVLDNKR